MRRVFGALHSGRRDDVVVVMLIGHGSLDAGVAKFNLVGPDLDAAQWARVLEGLPGRLVFVNATGASFPFLEQVSAPNRIVITATDSTAQRFDTVFPDLFVKAIADPATDQDSQRAAVALGGLHADERRGTAVLRAARPARDGARAAR